MNKRTQFLVISGLIAALYAALTYMSAFLGLAYGQVQLRLSEALCVLCAFSPAAIAGLTVGCFLGNFISTLGITDMIIGALATFLAALLGRALSGIKFKGVPLLLPLPFVAVNMVAIGAELAFFAGETASFAVFCVNAALVGIGQAIVCYAIGIPLYVAISRSRLADILNGRDAP